MPSRTRALVPSGAGCGNANLEPRAKRFAPTSVSPSKSQRATAFSEGPVAGLSAAGAIRLEDRAARGAAGLNIASI